MLKFADMSKDRVLQVLKTDEQGLSESEVKVRREKYGDNQLKKGKKTSPIGLFFSQFGDVMTILLIAEIGRAHV